MYKYWDGQRKWMKHQQIGTIDILGTPTPDARWDAWQEVMDKVHNYVTENSHVVYKDGVDVKDPSCIPIVYWGDGPRTIRILIVYNSKCFAAPPEEINDVEAQIRVVLNYRKRGDGHKFYWPSKEIAKDYFTKMYKEGHWNRYEGVWENGEVIT